MNIYITLVAPFHDCEAIIMISCWLTAFALPLNSTLFLIRIWGVFHDNRKIRIVFVILWSSTFCSLLSPFASTANHVGPTDQCITEKVDKGDSAGFFALTTYDTLVLLAISVKILVDTPATTLKDRIRLFFGNEGMGHLYRMVLWTGQLYYL